MGFRCRELCLGLCRIDSLFWGGIMFVSISQGRERRRERWLIKRRQSTNRAQMSLSSRKRRKRSTSTLLVRAKKNTTIFGLRKIPENPVQNIAASAINAATTMTNFSQARERVKTVPWQPPLFLSLFF